MEKQKEGKKVWLTAFVFLIVGLVLGLLFFNSGITGNAVFNLPWQKSTDELSEVGATVEIKSTSEPVTYEGVMDMLQGCIITASNLQNYNLRPPFSPSNVCERYNSVWGGQTKCLMGFVQTIDPDLTGSPELVYLSIPINCENSDQSRYLNLSKSYIKAFCCSAPQGNQTNATTCYDSDGGKNYYVKGTLNNNIQKTDFCVNGTNRLGEYYCEPEGYNGIESLEYYSCSYGCYDGACKRYPPVNQTNQTTE